MPRCDFCYAEEVAYRFATPTLTGANGDAIRYQGEIRSACKECSTLIGNADLDAALKRCKKPRRHQEFFRVLRVHAQHCIAEPQTDWQPETWAERVNLTAAEFAEAEWTAPPGEFPAGLLKQLVPGVHSLS